MTGERINNTPRRTAWDSLSETPEASVFEKWSKEIKKWWILQDSNL